MLNRDELARQLEAIDRQGGRESLFYLGKHILGYDALERNPHQDVCKFAEDVVSGRTPSGDKTGLDLEPRGSLKTTQFSQMLPIKLLINNPDLRILLDSAVLQNSIDNLRVVKQQFEGNEKLRFLYGNFVGSYWTTEEITVSKRKKMSLKEPSIRCASVERVQVGPHYDVIIADDLVSDENSKTEEGRQKVILHIKLLLSLLEPGGVLLLVGTRWHFEDAYGWIMATLPEFARRIKDAEIDGPNGGLYFPQRLSQKALDAIKKIQGRDIYSCQYKNNPAPEDENAAFQRRFFQPYKTADLDKMARKGETLVKLGRPENTNGFLMIDPGGEKKGSDEWVIGEAYVDADNDKWMEKMLRGNWKMREFLDHLFAKVAEMGKKLQRVGLETTGGQKWVHEAVIEEMRKRSTYFTIVPLPHAKDSKEYRIKNLQPAYAANAIYHSEHMGPLEEQLLRYPRGKDDVADTFSMLLEIGYAPRAIAPKEQKPATLEGWLAMEANKARKGGSLAGHSILGTDY